MAGRSPYGCAPIRTVGYGPSGHIAAAKWALSRELWTSDPQRAHVLLGEAIKHFETATATWNSARDDAADWLATNGNPTTKPKKRR